MYIARQLSFTGVTFDVKEVKLCSSFIEMYDAAVNLVCIYNVNPYTIVCFRSVTLIMMQLQHLFKNMILLYPLDCWKVRFVLNPNLPKFNLDKSCSVVLYTLLPPLLFNP